MLSLPVCPTEPVLHHSLYQLSVLITCIILTIILEFIIIRYNGRSAPYNTWKRPPDYILKTPSPAILMFTSPYAVYVKRDTFPNV